MKVSVLTATFMLPGAGGILFDQKRVVRNNKVGLYSELNLHAQPRYQSIANIFHLYFQVRYKANTSFLKYNYNNIQFLKPTWHFTQLQKAVHHEEKKKKKNSTIYNSPVSTVKTDNTVAGSTMISANEKSAAQKEKQR